MTRGPIRRGLRARYLVALFAAPAVLIVPAADAAELVDAAKRGDAATVVALLDARTDANEPAADGTTALHWAVRHNDIDLATRLIAAGADATAANRYGVTPLYLAALNGSATMIDVLLEAGADPNEISNVGETVLMTAAQTGVVAAAEALIAAGADVDAREDWHGQTALMWAAAEGHVDMVAALLEAGAEVDALTDVVEWERQSSDEPRAKWLPPGGFTALLLAAREGCTGCIPVLVEAGADVNATTAEDISGVVLALINGYYDTAMALLEAG
ncbi:MAG: ankyrin repeat domain-containing protein, partial [Gammaproteobacteria bacterium]|nr:ankyrin repeat domain-containing protein [Gammaproteobacteria bacterium]